MASTTSICDGCGAPIDRLDGYAGMYGEKNDGVTVEIAPGKRVSVCSSPRYYAPRFETVESSMNPKLPCIRKAWEKAASCPGCGEETNPFEGLCGGCQDTLSRAREMLGDRPSTYALDAYLLSSAYPDRETTDQLLDLICRVATSSGPRRRRSNGTGRVLPAGRRRGGYGEAHTGMPSVELDDAQKEALEELGGAIRALVDRMYHQGRRDGRDLLGRLASGEASIQDFEEKHKSWNEEEGL